MCNGIKIVWLGFENLPKMTKKQPVLNFSIFSKKVETSQTNFSTVILHHARFIIGQRQQNRLAVILETYPEVAEK